MLPSDETFSYHIPLSVQPPRNETHKVYCSHNNPAEFICRHAKCLASDSYMVCSEDCLTYHFKHPEDLISYETFKFSLPSLRKQTINMQVALSSILRETINKLLHLRITISQEIDKQLEKVKSMIMLYQRDDQWNTETEGAMKMQNIKEYIYKIQDYKKSEETVVYNIQEEHEENEKQVRENVKRMWRRLGRNIRELFGIDIGVFEGEDVGDRQKKKSYEYKVEGNIIKVVKLIKSTPKHVDRLKIYLNEEQIDLYPARNQIEIQIWVKRRQIREQMIESILVCVTTRKHMKHC